MHIAIFGLTLSSSWGNGHATLWRSLINALLRHGHTVVFYERDVPYYASTRDLWELPDGGRLRFYQSLNEIVSEAKRELTRADLAICTSFCPDGALASELILGSNAGLRIFYDMDTPVTLASLRTGASVEYLPADGLAGFDLVLSYTGGHALTELRSRLGARAVAPLYGWVDPQLHYPVEPVERFRAALSYLGTYAEDRQAALAELFLEPARRLPQQRFLIAGAQYPQDFPWAPNLFFAKHLEPAQHCAFFCSGRATLNVTRRTMAQYGYCPSGRLFEAAACGSAILSDGWEGLATFFRPGEEILEVHSADDVLSALSLEDAELKRIAKAGRSRTLEDHTADRRARELEVLCEQALATKQTDVAFNLE
jgi:spore maturation protein CgeB